MAKVLFKLALSTAKVLGRTVQKTIKEEIRDSQEAAKILKASKTYEEKKSELSLDEACQILYLQRRPISEDEILTRYEHLFNVNKGVSFYIQSKVLRAKDRLLKDICERKKLALK